MAFLPRFIPHGKKLEAVCFLVLVFSQTGYFFGDQCPSQSSLFFGVPPLDWSQVQQVRDAIADGTVDQIRSALEADGPIFVGNTSFPPIVTLTEAQMAAIERCYNSPVPITIDSPIPNRRKRDSPGQQVNLACDGGIGSVLYTVDGDGSDAQVMVNDLPSGTDCTLATPLAGTSECCCFVEFFVNSVGIILAQDPDIVFKEFAVEHCTCCNT